MPEALILGAISPAAWTVVVSFGITGNIVPGAFILGATWLLISWIFSNPKGTAVSDHLTSGQRDSPPDKIELYLGRTTAGFAIMIYPGLFFAWVIQMAVFKYAGYVIFIFLFATFLNDGAAWAAGNLFGKNNRGFISVSPKKSIAGFAGGIIISIITGISAVLLFPEAFTSDIMPSIPAGAILGFFTGMAAILGDLGESALKRSAGIKDSGSLILGRGGALDSVDSLLLAAPVYYVLYRVFF